MILADQNKQSIMLPSPESTGKKKQDERDLLEARLINNPQQDVLQAYNKARQDLATFSVDEAFGAELSQFANKQKGDTLGSVETLVGHVPADELVETLESVNAIDEVYSDTDAKEQMRVQALAPPSLSELDKQYKAVEQYAHSLVQEAVEAQGGWETAGNIAGLLMPDATKDFYETFGGVEEFEEFKEYYHQLDPEQQYVLLPELIRVVTEGYDNNPYDVQYVVSQLYDHHTGSRVAFDAIMDVFAFADVVGVAKLGKAAFGAKALTSVKNFRASASKAKQAENIGALETAAARQAAASKGDDALDAVNTTKADVARSADPMPTHLLDDGTSLDTVAGKMDNFLRTEYKTFPPLAMPANRLSAAISEVNVTGRGASVAKANDTAQLSVGPARSRRMEEIASQDARILNGENADIMAAVKKAVKEEAAIAALRNTDSSVSATEGVTKQLAEDMDAALDEMVELDVFTTPEIDRAVATVYDKLRSELNASGQQMASLTPIEHTPNSVTYQIKTESGINNRTMRFNKDDVHTRTENVDPKEWTKFTSTTATKLFSPSRLLEDIGDGRLVDDVTFAGMQASAIRNKLSEIWKRAEKGLTRKENEEVNAVLKVGDEEGIEEFAIADLRAGTPESKLGSWSFTDRQIESYLLKRQFYRKLHQFKDAQLRRELQFAGYRTLTTTTTKKDGSVIAASRFAKPTTFKEIEHKKDVLVHMDDKAVSLDDLKGMQSRLADEGYDIIEYLDPRKIGGKSYTHGVVKKTDRWSDLPKRVLHYQNGYVPRQYKKGYYFVRTSDKSAPIRYMFESRDEAMAYIARREEAGESGLKVYGDGEFSVQERIKGEAQGYGGLITGARSRHQLKVMKDGQEVAPDRLSVAHSTDRYLNNIAAVMPLVEYRAAAMARWERDVNALAKTEGRNGVKRGGFNTEADEIDLSKEMKAKMLIEREYIRENMGMATDKERLTQQLMLDLAAFAERKGYNSVKRWAMDRSDADVNNWLKGQTFSLMMGWFNPRQIFVQASNASLAASMHPINGAKAMKEFPSFYMYLNTPKKHRAALAKRLGISDDTIKNVEDFEKSGMYDSIARQGDFNNHDLGVQHTTLDRVRQLSHMGLAPFRQGELTARIMAWNIGRRNLGEGATIEQKAKEALRLNMNMQQENAAWWQKAPVVGLMTQFLQVQAKWMENVLPVALGGSKRWTGKEKAAAAAGQILLYGTLGVPMAQSVISMLAGGDEGFAEFAENNPETVEYINEGFTHAVLSLFGAEDVTVGTSMSLWSGLGDNVVADIFKAGIDIFNGGYSDQGFLETMSGPSATTIRRIGSAVDHMIDGVKLVVSTPSLETAQYAILSNLDGIAQLTSTWSNTRKAMLLSEAGVVYSSNHRANINVGDVNLQEVLAKAMGFPLDAELLMYSNTNALKANKADRDAVRKDLREAIINTRLYGNPDAFTAIKAVLLSGYTIAEKQKIMDEVIATAFASDTKLDRELQQALKQYVESGGRIELTPDQIRLINKVGN